jgi:DNA-binding NtrC family response regulator/HAMP domain-containing protein
VLLLYVAAPLALVVGIVWLLTTARVEAMTERRMQEEVELIARALTVPVGRALEQGDTDRLRDSLWATRDINRVYGAYVYDARGDVVAALGEPPTSIESLIPRRAARGDRTGAYGEVAGRRTYSYFVPLTDVGGRIAGMLQVTRRRRDFDDGIWQLRAQAGAALAGATLLLVGIVVWGHHRALGRHVERLARDMSRVRTGDSRHRAAVAGFHEIRILADSLNDMLDDIQASQTELDRQRERHAELELKLHESRKLAALGELAGGVAGELGAPLRVIEDRAERAVGSASLAPADRCLVEDVRTQVRRMAGVVSHLLKVGRDRSADSEAQWQQFQELAGEIGFHGMVGRSRAMQRLFFQIAQVAHATGPVLIAGESGTGKELVARAVHRESARAHQPFVAVNCAGIPEHLIESEFFGHTAGAFTGASRTRKGLFLEADGGVLLLDEIADLPLPMQATLLRVLQEGTVRPVGADSERRINVRILAATNRDLEDAVRRGSLRQDLFYRLEALMLRVPALRDRDDDLELLMGHFLRRFAGTADKSLHAVSAAALERLRRYPFPGNVRELQNAIQSAVTFCEGPAIEVAHLPARIRDARIGAGSETAGPEIPIPMRSGRLPTLAELGDWYVRHVVGRVRGNKRRAAEILGIGRGTLYRRLDPSAEASGLPPTADP